MIPKNQHEGLEGIEALAACEHESWSKWTRWMIDQLRKGMYKRAGEFMQFNEIMEHGFEPTIARWERQMVTPYSELSEKEKESDREVVREKARIYLDALVHMGEAPRLPGKGQIGQ